LNYAGKNCHVKFTEKQIGWLCNFLTDPCFIEGNLLTYLLTHSLAHLLTHSLTVPEGKNLVILITNKVNACTDDFTAASIGKMVLGLKCFDTSAR
jgi:hypothetical protein